MSIFKCKMCGGELQINPGESVAVCEYCGTTQTLPIYIYSMTRKRISPEINALSAIMFVVILTIILAANAVDSAKERRLRRAARAEEGRR